MKPSLIQVVLSFVRLGFVAFGGPAAAYAMMRQEFVVKRRWLSEETFFEFLGIANLVPGPNATEMAMLIGFSQAGWWGLVLGGVCYILPSMSIVMVLAWIYVQFGSLPTMEGILYGVKPVVVGILISAMWGMLKHRIKNYSGLVVAIVVCAAYLMGVSPLLLLLAGGALLGGLRFFEDHNMHSGFLLFWLNLPLRTIQISNQPPGYDVFRLFLVFLKAGALMLGSGYVLLAFIHDDLVVRLRWLTDSQLVDAIAVGQVTPGPLSTTATFVGYLLGGIPAALLSTLAMFLPSFIIVVIVVMIIDKIRDSEHLDGILEGVSFAALGLMAGVTWEIIGTSVVDPFTGVIAISAMLLLLFINLGASWLVLAGAVIGLLKSVFF